MTIAATADAGVVASTAPSDVVEDTEPRPRDRRFLWLLIGALVVGGGLRVAIGLTDDAPSSDETAYLASGISLVEGDGFEREGHPELHFPPLVPLVLGLASKVFSDPHTGAVWVAVVAGTATIAPLALLARRIAGDAAGGISAWFGALAPGLATLPATRGTGSETEYVLLVVTGLWLAVSAADREDRAALTRVAGAGLMLGLAYLTRPEGLWVAVPVGAAIALLAARRSTTPATARRRTALTTAAVFVLPLMVCVVPYVAYLHGHTGRWELTGKMQDVSLEAWDAVARGDRHARDQILYALDESGYRFADERTPLMSLARDDPGGYVGIVGTNARELLVNVMGVSLLPLPVWALAGYAAWRRRRSAVVVLLLAAAALPVLTALAFFVQPRYLTLVAAVGAVLASVGVVHLSGRWRHGVLGLLLLMLAATSVQAFRGDDAGWWHPDEHSDQREAGEWLATHSEPDDRIMTRSMVVELYADRRAVPPPYADLATIVDFARHYGVRYLVVDEAHTERLRPQLRRLLSGFDIPALRLVHEVEAEGRTTRVYALHPPPEPSNEDPPMLGFMGDN